MCNRKKSGVRGLNCATHGVVPPLPSSVLLLPQFPKKRADLTEIREAFTRSVVRRMMTDVPWGVLLSGELELRAPPRIIELIVSRATPHLGHSAIIKAFPKWRQNTR